MKELLTSLRKSKNLSQYEMAELLNIPRSTYAQYEVGRRLPETETLKKLALFHNISIDELLNLSVDNSNKIDLTFILSNDKYIITLNGKEMSMSDRIKLKEMVTVMFGQQYMNQ
ncbi:helix-turn-helix domain-containing protein [Paenibacillus sedimenti]|uniref:Helix-turn-helix transcriptional regulator n=1 Tax=Paenibacillus sedimenti TaxID=2770274 RepID=A0A926QNE5_9BACL|nr:helix-turn-helix transcriptional regulator [Paenibacillus sedimenti]MBD0384687.1 helix-turn-helix transcriptional regulator [Paenibacillus sedimenti]